MTPGDPPVDLDELREALGRLDDATQDLLLLGLEVERVRERLRSIEHLLRTRGWGARPHRAA